MSPLSVFLIKLGIAGLAIAVLLKIIESYRQHLDYRRRTREAMEGIAAARRERFERSLRTTEWDNINSISDRGIR